MECRLSDMRTLSYKERLTSLPYILEAHLEITAKKSTLRLQTVLHIFTQGQCICCIAHWGLTLVGCISGLRASLHLSKESRIHAIVSPR